MVTTISRASAEGASGAKKFWPFDILRCWNRARDIRIHSERWECQKPKISSKAKLKNALFLSAPQVKRWESALRAPKARETKIGGFWHVSYWNRAKKHWSSLRMLNNARKQTTRQTHGITNALFLHASTHKSVRKCLASAEGASEETFGVFWEPWAGKTLKNSPQKAAVQRT